MNDVRVVIAAALLTVLAACGVPTGDAAVPIPGSDVPHGLTSPTTDSPAWSAPAPVLDPTRVYLVAGDDELVPRGREVGDGSLRDRLGDLLGELADGPTVDERDQHFSTALPPDVELTAVAVSDGTATVDIGGSAPAPSGWSSRLAVAQIVLTATSLPTVDAVLLTVDGTPVDAPLPSGELTSSPLGAVDYTAFVDPATAPP